MSGIEVAGLILGAIPILVEAIDAYKDGIQKSKTAFRKRTYVKNLTNALLLQKQIVEGTVESVLNASGCHEDVWRLRDEPQSVLNDKHVQEQVLEFLGNLNNAAFSSTLEQSNEIIQKIAGNMAGLVPAFKGSTEDLLGIISANRAAPPKQLDLLPRVKLLFGGSELKELVRELDETICRFSNFVKIIVSNRQSVGSTSSTQAVNLAKALRKVRAFASNLYLALCQGWKADCHSQHEAKLFLEDRVDGVADVLRFREESSVPILIFQLVFAASVSREQVLWHETSIQVFNNENANKDSNIFSSHSLSSSKVTFAASQTQPVKPEVTYIADICGAIKARSHDRHVAFVLTDKQQVGMIQTDKEMCIAHQEPDTTTLRAVFLSAAARSARRGPILALKFRMLLALKLASNLLQLLQTQWLTSPWSKDIVCFVIQQRGAENGVQHLDMDVGRPFVSLTFGSDCCTAISGDSQQKVEAKVALLELGILLLEIWHEESLEIRFSLTEAPVGYYKRMALAVEWFDDASNPLLDLYEKAVSHCIFPTIGNKSHLSDWEDMKFWGAVCGDVIDPLSKICKQFH